MTRSQPSINLFFNVLFSCTDPKKDCADWYMAGFNDDGPRHIQPRGTYAKREVYCEMDTEGGWTVIHARKGRIPNFYTRPWDDFKRGFHARGWDSFWLGNDLIHNITRQKTYELKVIGTMPGGNPTVAARYTMFLVEDEAKRYKLRLGDFVGDDADNMLEANNGQPFVTIDRRGEEYSYSFPIGWWASEYDKVHFPRDALHSSFPPFMQMEELKMMIKPA
ncbi:techylectin-5A-like [Branchiostoma lanceolatum]|uniref:techylectin-5A-like n=1 Tax=Branchiostoma lanceolatum TaxID=7740 RepID=UPI003452F4F8